MPESLVIVEEEAAVVVAWESDADDWLVSFAKSSDFPAYDWAARMVQLYNTQRASPAPTDQSRTLTLSSSTMTS